MNGDWEIKSEQIWQSVVSARDYETLYQRVLSVTEDGEPLDREKIEKEIDKLNENAEEDRDRRSFKEPLDTLYFADYEFAIDSTFSGIPNSMKIDFSSKVRDGKHLDGHIVVNRDDYGIVHKEFHLADNPTGVKDHRMKLDFEKQANGYYYASRLDFRGQFGVLFFNSRRELIEEYSNYSFGHSFPDSLFDKKASYEPGRDDGVNR